MRIVHLCEFPTALGGEQSLLAILPELANRGCESIVACPSQGAFPDLVDRYGIARTAWNVRDAAGIRRPLAELRCDIAALTTRLRPDILHANSVAMSRIVGPLSQRGAPPVVGHLRDILKLSRAAIADLNRCRRLLAVSHATRDFHVRQGLSASRCRVVYNGIDLSRFRPGPVTRFLHTELGLPRESRLVASIGQLGIRKAPQVYLRAAEQLAAEHDDLQFLLVGARSSAKAESRELERQLHELAARSQLSGRVHFLSPRDDIPEVLRELSLLVHAARQEPLGRVLLEAAACGVPIVATDVGGTAEIFPPDSCAAHLVATDRCDEIAMAALATGMRRILSDSQLARQMGNAARRRCASQFGTEQAGAATFAEFATVLADGD